MSLPSSPTVKNAGNNFDSYEEDLVKKPRSSSEKTKKEQREKFTAGSSSSLGLGRKTFLEGLKIKSRTKSGDNLTGGLELEHNGSQSDEKLSVSPARRLSESAKQVSQLINRNMCLFSSLPPSLPPSLYTEERR